MKKTFTILATAALLLFSGCGYKEGVRTDAQKAYLYFTGPVDGAQVSIDNGTAFEIRPGPQNRYEIEPGKHTLRVVRDGNVVVDRVIFVGDGVAKEIEVR